jgi:hypothetical protein
MNRCLIFIASLFFAFVAISSTASASPSEWRFADHGQVSDAGSAPSPGNVPSWATVPAPRLFAFVTIQL